MFKHTTVISNLYLCGLLSPESGYDGLVLARGPRVWHVVLSRVIVLVAIKTDSGGHQTQNAPQETEDNESRIKTEQSKKLDVETLSDSDDVQTIPGPAVIGNSQ